MKKILVRIATVLVALMVVSFLCRNFIARKVVEIAANKMTGFPLEIGSVDIGLFSGTLEVRDFQLMNPSEFHGGTFVKLPLVRVDYDTMSFLRRAPHIKELTVNVAEVDLVKNEKGESNATVLQNRAESISGSKQTGSGAPKDEKKMSYRVDLVKIHVGTVIKRSFSSDGKPNETKLSLNVDATYKDVNESTSISKLIMDTVFGQLGAVAGEMIKGAGATVKDAGQTLQKTGKGLFDNLKKAIPQH
ncbi:MAG: hypothetical protein WCH84_03825 [Verrucomicrobiota bacterium]